MVFITEAPDLPPSAAGLRQAGERVTIAIGERERHLLISFRQALLIVLGAVEEYLSMERSVPPRHGQRRGTG